MKKPRFPHAVVGICFVASAFATSGGVVEFGESLQKFSPTRSLKVPLNELYTYFTNRSRVPEVVTTTFVVDLNPVQQPFNATLISAFEQSLSYFFDLIFQAQTEYDISVRTTEVTNQQISVDQTLSLVTTVDCIFQPQSDQALSDQDLEHILIHVINRYQSHLIKYMHRQQTDFGLIETAFGHSVAFSPPSLSHIGGVERNTGLIVATVLASLLLAVSLTVSYLLYKRQWSNPDGRGTWSIFPKFARHGQVAPFDPARENLSPFRDKEEMIAPQVPQASPESADLSGLQQLDRPSDEYHQSSLADEDGTMETIEFSRQPHPTNSRRPQNDYLGFSRRSNAADERSSASRMMSLDMPSLSPQEGSNETDEEEGTLIPHSLSPASDETIIFFQNGKESAAGSRFEVYAPPGKLGVAIDVVNGHPVVYRIKAGSPLTGFLRKMDRIVEIDGVDTTHMSAADVTNLMVKNMSKRRKITYMRGDGVFS